MFGLGLVEIFTTLSLLFFGYALVSSFNVKLVVQKLEAHELATSEAPCLLELSGRQQGFFSFRLTLVGLSPVTSFRLTPVEVCCNSTSLFGRRNQAIPLRAISSVDAGVRKPISYLFVACSFLFIGLFGSPGVLWRQGFFPFLGTLLVCGIFAALFAWLYTINKTFFISIFKNGGPPLTLAFKPNVIEGVPLDLEKSLELAKIIRTKVVECVAVAQIPPSPVSDPQTPLPVVRQQPGHSFAEEPQPLPFAPTANAYVSDTASSTDLAETLLERAREFIKQGMRQEAVDTLREIVRQFPMSQEANIARANLEKAGLTV